ncbi:hypothetical protein [Streptomyces sp. NPDC048277]|uniref:hypothetical protein n=1 Tax=Streptomyces sp. NPDC048277 TaxID=3155027 RepID=UPI0033E94277
MRSTTKLGQYDVEPTSGVALTTAVSGQNLAGRSWPADEYGATAERRRRHRKPGRRAMP